MLTVSDSNVTNQDGVFEDVVYVGCNDGFWEVPSHSSSFEAVCTETTEWQTGSCIRKFIFNILNV